MSPTCLQIQCGKVGLAHLTPSLPVSRERRPVRPSCCSGARVVLWSAGREAEAEEDPEQQSTWDVRVQAPPWSTACSESLVLGVPAAAFAHVMDEGVQRGTR
jgi:hypothetical protein